MVVVGTRLNAPTGLFQTTFHTIGPASQVMSFVKPISNAGVVEVTPPGCDPEGVHAATAAEC